MEAMIAGFEVDFAWILQAVMHERDFMVTTTYKFSCMVFYLCRFTGVPIWNIDQIKTPPGTVDIGLIRDNANKLDPYRRPCPEVPSLGENLAGTVEKAQAATQATYEPYDNTPIESISGGSIALRSSRSTPFATFVPLARVKKHESQNVHSYASHTTLDAEVYY